MKSAPDTRLDDATLLVSAPDAEWVVLIRPGCGEATLRRDVPRSEVQRQPGGGHPERSEAEANRRATQSIRRIIAEHRCTRFVTLTLAPEHATQDRSVMTGYLREFQRWLGSNWPDLVYVLVPEPHPGGHGWHVHGAMSQFVPKAELTAGWGRGFVDVRRFKAKGAAGGREAARRAGAYLAKYVAKSLEEGRAPGSHRFYRPQNIRMRVLEARGTFAECWAALESMMTTPVTWWWSSRGVDSWRGPPVVSVRW